MVSKLGAVLAGALLLSGCVVERAGPTRYDSKEIERGNAEAVSLRLHMGAGKLRVEGGSDKLMRADFTYNVPGERPEVRYDSNSNRPQISIKQPSGVHNVGNSRYEWNVRLNREVPADVSVNFGAGDAVLDIGRLNLRNVNVHMGVGKLELDLRGHPAQGYKVEVHGGVGEAVVRLPADVGIVAEAQGGIGEIRTSGLRKEDGRYVNEHGADAKVLIRLDIHGGIGAIRLLAE